MITFRAECFIKRLLNERIQRNFNGRQCRREVVYEPDDRSQKVRGGHRPKDLSRKPQENSKLSDSNQSLLAQPQSLSVQISRNFLQHEQCSSAAGSAFCLGRSIFNSLWVDISTGSTWNLDKLGGWIQSFRS